MKITFSQIGVSLFILFCVFTNYTPAQTQHYDFEIINTEDGLSQGMIFDIFQCSDGFLWFGTKNGLNRYDGHEFIVYSHEPKDSTSISGSQVTAIFEDSRGYFWVGTKDSGLNLFDRKNQVFYKVKLADSMRLSSIWEIEESPEGDIILGTYRYNLVKIPKDRLERLERNSDFTIELGELEQVSTIDSFLEESLLFHDLVVYRTHEDRMLVGAGNGLFELNPKTMKLSKFDLPEFRFKEEILAITQDEDNNLFIARKSEVLIFRDGRWTRVDLELDDNEGEGYKLRNILLWKDKLLLNAYSHAFEIDLKSLESKAKAIQGFNGMPVTTSLVDDAGNLWFGTNGIGLLKFSEFKKGIEGHFLDNSIWDFYPHNDSMVWIESNLECLLYNFKNEEVAFTSKDFGYVRDLVKDQYGRTWLLKREIGGGIAIYEIDENYILKTKILMACKSNLKSSMIQSDNSLFISGTECELSQFNLETKKETVFSYKHLFDRDSTLVVSNHFFKSKSDEKIWIALNKGLVSCTLINDSLICEKIYSGYIHYLMEDPVQPEKYIWCGTKNSGLLKIDRATKSVFSISKKDGLLDNEVYAMDFDKNKFIWLSTNRGVSRLDESSNSVINYTVDDGFQGPEFNSGAVFKDNDGYLFFGSVNGFSRFDASQIKTSDYHPQTKITHLEINGANRDDLLGEDKTVLRYDQNNLTFYFSSLDFSAPNKNTFQYRILGLGNQWRSIGNNRSATFGQINPGKYTFEVMGSNRSGVYGEDMARFEFVIKPPFWRTNLAYLFYGIVVISLIWFFFTSQLRRYRIKKELELNKKEAQRLEQLEQIKSNFFSNITHELRTPLTLIVEPLRQILKQDIADDVRKRLNLVGKSSLRLLNLVNSLLDIAKIESKVMKPAWSLGNLEEHILKIIESHQILADKKEIKIEFTNLIEEELLVIDAEKIEKIFTNIYGNAIKYTPTGTISVKLESVRIEEIRYLHLEIADTGIGISEENLTRIFDRFEQLELNKTSDGVGIGMSLTKELVELLDGKIKVTSIPDKGTTVAVHLPWKETEEVNLIQPNDNSTKNNAIFDQEIVSANNDENIEDKPIVLLVEDNDELRDFLKSSLQNMYTVFEAKDGQQGYEKSIEIIPDVIISDVRMPIMDGFEMCAKLKSSAATSHIPVILLTAKSSLKSRISGVNKGADVYLTKPFSVDEVKTYIVNLLEKRKLLWNYFQSVNQTDEEVANPLPSGEETFITSIEAIIDQQMSNENLDINLILKEAGVSRTHLHRKLKALTGQSTTEFIRNRRLNKAMDLLKANPELDVTQAAYTVGFSNQSYFSTKFKEKFGFPPSHIGSQR